MAHFAGAVMVQKPGSKQQIDTMLAAVAIVAESQEEAKKMLRHIAFDEFPPEEGWTNHRTQLTTFKDDERKG